MQWTGPRRREYEAYCNRNKLNPADMDTNYKFLFVELKGPEGRVLEKMKYATTLDDKVEVFSKTFLRPGIPHMDSRKVWAKRAYTAYVNDNPTTLPHKHVQEVTESVPAPKTVDDTPWWLKLLLRLLEVKK